MGAQNNMAAEVAAVIDQVLRDSGRSVRAWRPEESLMGDIGLDSLDLAVVVVQLEQRVGVDPFRSGSGGVRTFGDFVARYESAREQAAGAADAGGK